MLKFLKRIFRRDGAAATAPVVAAPVAVQRAAEKSIGSGVEVASLSLRAILEKLPPELHAIINQLPEPGVKIMLPVNTILKQLPTGAVRMSLASLLRQAPAGTFRKTQVEEKQMVDVHSPRCSRMWTPGGSVAAMTSANTMCRRMPQDFSARTGATVA